MPARLFPLLTSLALAVSLLFGVQALSVRGWLYKFEDANGRTCEPAAASAPIRFGPQRVTTWVDLPYKGLSGRLPGSLPELPSGGNGHYTEYPILPPTCPDTDEDDPRAVIFYRPAYLTALLALAFAGGLVATAGLVARCFLVLDTAAVHLLLLGSTLQFLSHSAAITLFLIDALPLPPGLHLTQGIGYCALSALLSLLVALVRGYDHYTSNPAEPEEFFGLSDRQARLVLSVNGFVLYLIFISSLYSMEEGHSFDDAVYWAVVTSCTIGFGDFTVTTQRGRLVFPFLAGGGIALTTNLVLAVRDVVLEGIAMRFAGTLSKILEAAESDTKESSGYPSDSNEPPTPPHLRRRGTVISILTAPQKIEGGKRREFSVSGGSLRSSFRSGGWMGGDHHRVFAEPGFSSESEPSAARGANANGRVNESDDDDEDSEDGEAGDDDNERDEVDADDRDERDHNPSRTHTPSPIPASAVSVSMPTTPPKRNVQFQTPLSLPLSRTMSFTRSVSSERAPRLARRMSLDPAMLQHSKTTREIRIKRGKNMPTVTITTDFKLKRGDLVRFTREELNRFILFGITLLLLHLAVFGVLFAYLESWTAIDGWYFTFLSLTTIGYGDLTPTSLHAKTVFIGYVLLGIPNLTFLGSVVGERVGMAWKVNVGKKDRGRSG